MKVLVSGSSGFLGSWIVRVLSEHHEIYALTRIDSNLRNLDGIRNIHIAKIDSRRWPDYVRDVSPEALIVNDWWGVENAYRNDLRQLENVERISKFVRAGLDVQVNTVIGIGSQAELGTFVLQNVGGKFYWVAPLVHSGFFKYWSNADQGTPGYVKVSANDDQDVELVTQVNGKKLHLVYQTGAYFMKNLYNYLYFKGYSTYKITLIDTL